MQTKRMMVRSMFISIITAGVFCFGLTGCSNNDNGVTPEPGPKDDYTNYESYGLTYPYFDNADDVKILNADTTEIAVKKSLADKLGIKTFVNHPIGIWDAPTHLAYGRKALEERLDGDTYILKVTTATVAELIGDRVSQLSTDIFINRDADAVKSFSAQKGVSEFAAKYMEADGTIHPCMVHKTDRFGYKKEYYLEGEDHDPDQIMAHKLGEFQSMTPEEILQQRNGSERVRIISLHNNIKFDYDIPIDDDSKDSINIAGEIPIDFDLDYFITIDPGVDWHWYGPELIVEKFETGLAGDFGFHPSLTVGFKKELKLDEDKGKIRLASFNGFSFTFTVGTVPVTVEISPSLNLVFDASVNAIECDKYDQQPNEKGKIAPKFAEKNAQRLWMGPRNQLVNAGQEAAKNKENATARKYWQLFAESDGAPLFKACDRTAQKAYFGQVAYFAALFAYQDKDMDKAVQLCDIAMGDSAEYDNGLNLKLEVLGSEIKTKEDSLKYIGQLKDIYAEHKTDAVMEKLYNMYLATGEKATAEALLDQALAANPNNFVALADKGMGMLNDKPAEAANYLKKAFELKSDNALLATYAGTALSMQAQTIEDAAQKKALYQEAIKYYDKAKELDPDMLQAKWGYNRYNAYYNFYGEDAPETKQAEADSK